MKNVIYKALNTLDEYLSACSFSSSYVETTPSPGQFTYDANTKAVHLNADGNLSYFWNIETPTLNIGDIIEVEAEFANIGNGELGKIAIVNNVDNTDYTQYLSKNQSNEFDKLHIRHLVQTDGSFRVGAGISSGATGEIKVRNVKVKVHTDNNETEIDLSQYKLKSDYRKCVIEANDAFSSKFVARTDYSTDEVSISVGVDGIVCTWSEPFESGKRPVPTLTLDYVGNGSKYIGRIGAVTDTGFIVKFYDATTNTIVNIADMDLSASVFIYVVVQI